MQGVTQREIFPTEAEARAALYQAQSQNRAGYVLRYGELFEVRHWPLLMERNLERCEP